MSHYAEERYDVYDETFPRARKAHECDACELPIRPGDKYARVSTVFDGSAETVKRCLRCQGIHEHLRKLGSDHDMWPAEKLDCGEDYEDHWDGPPPPEIAELAFIDADEAQRRFAGCERELMHYDTSSQRVVTTGICAQPRGHKGKCKP